MSWVVSLVEDDDDIREHLAEVLKARGLKVVEARQGAEALEEIRRRGIRPSLMLLDLMMPVMDGWAVLNAQASEPLLDGVPVIVITAQDPGGPLPATVQAVFQKPFSLALLLDTVRHVCADLDPPRRAARGSDGLKPPLKPPSDDGDPT
jgi:CheY-like chemotaxis protein